MTDNGQGVQEDPAVGLAQDPGVEDRDDPGISARADQAAEALLELQDRLGDLVLDERVAPAPADRECPPLVGPPASMLILL